MAQIRFRFVTLSEAAPNDLQRCACISEETMANRATDYQQTSFPSGKANGSGRSAPSLTEKKSRESVFCRGGVRVRLPGMSWLDGSWAQAEPGAEQFGEVRQAAGYAVQLITAGEGVALATGRERLGVLGSVFTRAARLLDKMSPERTPSLRAASICSLGF